MSACCSGGADDLDDLDYPPSTKPLRVVPYEEDLLAQLIRALAKVHGGSKMVMSSTKALRADVVYVQQHWTMLLVYGKSIILLEAKALIPALATLHLKRPRRLMLECRDRIVGAERVFRGACLGIGDSLQQGVATPSSQRQVAPCVSCRRLRTRPAAFWTICACGFGDVLGVIATGAIIAAPGLVSQ